jgi:signal transduction histidine kinase
MVILEGVDLKKEPSQESSFLIMALDITARIQAEHTLKAQINLLHTVFNASTIGIAVLDFVRNTQGEIADFTYRLANPVLEQLTGKKLAGLRYLDMHPGFKTTGIFEKLKSVADTGQSQDFEHYYESDGFAHWLRITAVPLGDGIVSTLEDITSRKQMEAAHLQMRLNGQKALLQAILEAQEEERRRISESLHNGVGQILYATKLHLDQINLNQTPLDLEKLWKAKQKTDQLLSDAIKETRKVSHELIPFLLQEYGLAVAITDSCQRFSQAGLQISCYVLEDRLDKYEEMAIFRITQELVNNIVKHSQASRARIEIYLEKEQIIIEAQDNGKGIDLEQPWKGIGLNTIKDRVRLLEGTMQIDSVPGKGTLVSIVLPLQK